jgi:hypothetical protein
MNSSEGRGLLAPDGRAPPRRVSFVCGVLDAALRRRDAFDSPRCGADLSARPGAGAVERSVLELGSDALADGAAAG